MSPFSPSNATPAAGHAVATPYASSNMRDTDIVENCRRYRMIIRIAVELATGAPQSLESACRWYAVGPQEMVLRHAMVGMHRYAREVK